MPADVTSIRLPKKDAVLIDHLIEVGEFKSKSEFIRYAIKKTINEILLQEIQEKMMSEEKISADSIDELQHEIKEIRKYLWDHKKCNY
jgi:Arc/MetJ-type ribon-helix-helix transcriptional regulator